jgi:hypothetical protein
MTKTARAQVAHRFEKSSFSEIDFGVSYCHPVPMKGAFAIVYDRGAGGDGAVAVP